MTDTTHRRGLRRWLLLDEWQYPDGRRTRAVVSRFWTRTGAQRHHRRLVRWLRPRNGQASIWLHDSNTATDTRLSTQ